MTGIFRSRSGVPSGVMGASIGGSGATGGIESVVRILGRTRSGVPDLLVAVPFAERAFDDDLALADAELRAEAAELVSELAERACSSIAVAVGAPLESSTRSVGSGLAPTASTRPHPLRVADA